MIVCPPRVALSLWGDSGNLRASLLHTTAACLHQRGTFVSARHQHSLPTTSVSPSAACREEAKQLLCFVFVFCFFSQEIVIVLCISRGERTFLLQIINIQWVTTLRPNLVWGSKHTQEGWVFQSHPQPYCADQYFTAEPHASTETDETRRNFEAGVSTPPPPLSWIQIYALLQSHTSPTVCYRRTGMWLAEKADGSLNQSQWVCESWQTDCELGEMKLEQKLWTWRGLGSSKWNTGWPGKLLEVHHLRLQENTQMHTQVPLHSYCLKLSLGYCEEQDCSLGGQLKGGWNCCSL